MTDMELEELMEADYSSQDSAKHQNNRPVFVAVLILLAALVGALAYYFLGSSPESKIAADGNSEIFQTIDAFVAKEKTSVERSDDGTSVTLRSTVTSAISGGATGGIHVVIGQEFELAARGKTILISITARKTTTMPSPKFSVAYSTAGVGNSGWKEFTPEDAFKTFTFEYLSPPTEKPANSDIVGIWADPEGADRGIDVQSVKVSIKGT